MVRHSRTSCRTKRLRFRSVSAPNPRGTSGFAITGREKEEKKTEATKHLGEIEQRETPGAAVTATQTTADVLSSTD